MFVKVAGTPSDPSSIVVDVLGFHIMDVGTAGYTEFDYDESIVNAYEQHPEYMDCRMGMLHSHNRMNTFFSGTDIGELEDNTTDTDFMVSLIVNNASTYTAKIAWRTDEEVHIETTGWFGKKAIKSNHVHKNSSLYTIDLDIEIEGIEDLVAIDARILEVKEAKDFKAKLIEEARVIARDKYKTPTFAGERLHYPKQVPIFDADEDDSLGFDQLQEIREVNELGIPVMEGEVFDNLLGCLIVQNQDYAGTMLAAMGEVKRKVSHENIPMLVEMITDNLEDYYEQQYGEFCTMEASMEMTAGFIKELREYASDSFPIVEPLMHALSVELGEEDLNGMFP